MAPKATQSQGSERGRDEQRTSAGPQYGGEAWKVADDRGANERFGHARNDDAEPSEIGTAHDIVQPDDADDPEIEAKDPDTAVTYPGHESSGEREGIHRGAKPLKDKVRRR